MQLGAKGEILIKSFETLQLTGYQHPGDVPTIGWGHTGRGVYVGQHISLLQAQAYFKQDTAAAIQAIRISVKVPLNQNQFDAIVSFTFNVGIDAERHSTLLRLLNQGNYKAAAQQFLIWDHEGNKVLPGLYRRRKAEMALFLTPVVQLAKAA